MDQQGDNLPVAQTRQDNPVGFQRVLEMTPAGPQLIAVPIVTKQTLREAYLLLAMQIYTSPEPDPFHPDHEFDGMMKGEVILRKHIDRAATLGEREDLEAALDRLLDRAKQSSESFTVTANYEAYLKKLAAERGQIREAVDVTPDAADLEGFE